MSSLWADFSSVLPSLDFTPLVLLSASAPLQWAGARRAADGDGWAYIPGAGDDEESWAHGALLRGWLLASASRSGCSLLNRAVLPASRRLIHTDEPPAICQLRLTQVSRRTSSGGIAKRS